MQFDRSSIHKWHTNSQTKRAFYLCKFLHVLTECEVFSQMSHEKGFSPMRPVQVLGWTKNFLFEQRFFHKRNGT